MFFVERDGDGKIISLHRSPPHRNSEEKSEFDTEIIDFFSRSGADVQEQILAFSDKEVIRVLDDLIELLIKKGIIMLTELPQEAQDKLLRRKKVRAEINPDPLLTDQIL